MHHNNHNKNEAFYILYVKLVPFSHVRKKQADVEVLNFPFLYTLRKYIIMDSKLTSTLVSTAVIAGTLYWLQNRRNIALLNKSSSPVTTPSTNDKIFVDANMPRDAQGRTFHLNVKPGDGK